ncbi:MAG: ribonuclease E/G [Candidatus Njordarchaeota archaeon]
MPSWLCPIPMGNNKIRVRIRGVYSTALTKLFLEHGFEITQPSQPICERFSIEKPSYLSPHIDIQTRGSRALIESLQRYTDGICNLLLENLEDIVIYRHPFIKNSIWKGIVTRRTKDGYLVRYSVNMDGLLPLTDVRQEYHEGDLVVVEIKDIDTKTNKAILTDSISIPGDFVVLVNKEIIKVSRKIKGAKKIDLMDLGNILRPPGWGAIFRTSAMYASVDEISSEIEKLKQYAGDLQKKAEKAPAFTQIREGINLMIAYFSGSTKRNLDELRSQVTLTIKHHHWLKSLGKTSSFMIDFLEEYSRRLNIDINQVSEYVLEYVRKTLLPKVGSVIKIFHIKPSMRKVILGPAKIIRTKEESGRFEYTMFRKFSPSGYYDGINAPKETGDYGITFAAEGDTKLITAYFDMDSNLKGIYININTPIEFYSNSIRYLDLEIDVVKTYDGEIVILDRQKLDKYLEQKAISKKLYEKTQKLASDYKTWLENGGVQEILDECENLKEIIAKEVEA